jgi:hypothetical protein
MKTLNIVVEGSTEEEFVNKVIRPHLAQFQVYVYCRRLLTGWDAIRRKPAKGGLLKYQKLRNDIIRWIQEDRDRQAVYYSCFIDLYAFPQDDESPYTEAIRTIADPYRKVEALERAVAANIESPCFIPYIQLHEFEAFLLVKPELLQVMYPDKTAAVKRLARETNPLNPEEVNETPQNAPSKRIIRHIPEYEGQKAQVAPLVAGDIGLPLLREHCPHFNEWLNRLEQL